MITSKIVFCSVLLTTFISYMFISGELLTLKHLAATAFVAIFTFLAMYNPHLKVYFIVTYYTAYLKAVVACTLLNIICIPTFSKP